MIPARIFTAWWWRLARRPLRDHLVPRLMAWLLILVQLDAMVDFPATSTTLLAQPPWTAGAAWASLVGLHALSERHGVDAVLRHGRFAVLRRQPVSRWVAGVPALGLGLALCLPVALLGALWSRSPSVTLLWTLAAVGPTLAARARPGLALGSLLLGATTVSLAQLSPWAAGPLAALWAVGGLGTAGELALRHALPPGHGVRGLGWRPRGAVGALVQRDLLVLWRTDRRPLLTALGAAPLVGLMVAAASRSFGASALVTGTSVTLGFLAPLAVAAVAAVARGLGPQLDPPSWPVRARTRLASLALVAATTLVPSWAAAGVGGTLGAAQHLQLGSTVLTLALGTASLVAWRPARPDHGLVPYLAALVLGLSLFVGSPATLALGGLAWGAGAWALERRRRAR